jgi:hypothetical protein
MQGKFCGGKSAPGECGIDAAARGGFIGGMKMVGILVLAAVLCGCGSAAKDQAGGFLAAEREQAGVADPEAIRKGVEAFRGFFANVTAESVGRLGPGLYAEDVWFNDTLKTLRGRDEVLAYFLKTTGHVDSFGAVVDDVAVSGANAYVRWTMDVRFKGAGEPVRTVGMTLLRFDREGRVVLHQDFWDPAAGFYEHLPVLGPAMRWIKSRI